MIRSLYIKDFALIDELEIQFEQGFNILTGETGAGKSIIVGALNILLGERAQLESVRQGANKAIAEAILEVGKNSTLEQILKENEIEIQPELILRREVRTAGSRAFVNDTPVQLNVLKLIGEQLVDLHGQHDHQLLLKEDNHRKVIDNRPAVASVLKQYREKYQQVNSLRTELKNLKGKESELDEKQDLIRFQIKELREIDIKEGERQELEQEMKLLDGAEELAASSSAILQAGREADTNAMELIRLMEQSLYDIARIEPEFDSYRSELKAARISIEELLNFTQRYQDQIEFNPQRLDYIRKRLSDFRKMEKKYGKDADELPGLLQELESMLNLSDNFSFEIERLEKQIREETESLTDYAKALHHSRIQDGEKLAKEVEVELLKMGFNHSVFEVKVDWLLDRDGWINLDGDQIQCTPDGCDAVSFYISTNKGEDPKPLSKTASGGEISRIMLALKSILARNESLPVMIFDEIDTGISGPVALRVGRTMRELSVSCQILCITHLPQIASMAHHHFVVSKTEDDGRTVTGIEKLDNESHIREVAKLMSGAEVTQATIASARELISTAGS